MSFLKKLQKRWGISSIGQVIIILIVFALTGFSALYIRRPVFEWLGITSETPVWQRVGWWLLTILPIYNVLLLAYGFLFGQFRFFWEFEKKMLNRIAFWRKKVNH